MWRITYLSYHEQLQRPEKAYNNNNHETYRPFVDFGAQLHVHRDWFDALPLWIRAQLEAAFADSLLLKQDWLVGTTPVPPGPKSQTLYALMCRAFDYHLWYTPRLVSDVVRLKLTLAEKKRLHRLCARMYTDSPLHPDHVEDFEPLLASLQSHMAPRAAGYFVRLSCGSGKHDRPLAPLHTPLDVLDYLTTSRRFCDQEFTCLDKDTYLFILPWKPIEPKFEFRLFVHRNRVTACSQQHCYQVFDYTAGEVQEIVRALEHMDFLPYICYTTYIADIYYDPTERRMRLIECNNFGAWSPGGSSLFDWLGDYTVLHCGQMKELRLLSS